MATISKYANKHTAITTGYTNPTNGYADDTSYATAAPGGKNKTISAYWGFPEFSTSDIPNNSIISSVKVEHLFKVSTTGSIATEYIQLFLNTTALGSDQSDASEPAGDTLLSHTVTSGITLSDLRTADVVRARTQSIQGNSSTAVTFSIDYVKITVTYNTPPTCALNTPLNTSAITTLTPTLNFTGTDAQSEVVEYQIQLHTDNGFATPLLSAESTSNAGFTSGHPFASGVAKEYTLQTSLTYATTYYWRVRAKDPAGTNTYGVWSSINSFNTPPTVVLNSPNDSATNESLTPNLLFTGSDANISGALEYEVQIDTSNSFNNGYGATEQLLNFIAAEYSFITLGNSTHQGISQSFNPRFEAWLTSFDVQFNAKTGLPTGNVYAKLYLINSQYAFEHEQSIPVGSVLATSTPIDASLCSSATKQFIFDGTYKLLVSEYYALTLEYSSGDDGKVINIKKGGGTFPLGNMAYLNPPTWTYVYEDILCSIYGTKTVPMIDKFSSVPDTGFNDISNGAHTHPFLQGEQIQYAIQSALSSNTVYYWKVRTCDSVDAIWSVWATTRSFLTQSAWTGQPLKAYLGGSWQTKPLKAYIGGIWVTKSLKKYL